MPLYNPMALPAGSKRKLKANLKYVVKDDYGLELIDKFLQLDPGKRINADEALYHDFFWVDTLPCSIEKCLSMYEQNIMRPPVKKSRFCDNEGYKDRVYWFAIDNLYVYNIDIYMKYDNYFIADNPIDCNIGITKSSILSRI